MGLELLLNELCELAVRCNLVNYAAAGGSIYELNAETIKDYPFIFVSPTDEVEVGQSTLTYGLTLFYCDRLLSDASNDTQIYSVALDTLKNYIAQISELSYVVNVDDYNIRIFSETHKMADYLNGAYARVRITVLESACPTYFDETGAPIGTYIPSNIGDASVLEKLASKTWVVDYINEHGSGGGVSRKEVEEIVNEAVSGLTDDIDAISADTQAISAATQAISDDLQALSAATQAISEQTSGITAITVEVSEISAATETLSADTAQISDDLADLSGFTGQAVSSLTDDLQALSAATESGFTAISQDLDGKQDTLTAGSGITITNNVISTRANVHSETVFEIVSLTEAQYDALAVKDPNTLYIIIE